MNSYHEGRMNLKGQHKPDYLLAAITATEEAYDELDAFNEKLLARGASVGEDQHTYTTYNCLQAAFEQCEAYQAQMYRRWQRELAEAEAVAVEISVNVKENVLQ